MPPAEPTGEQCDRRAYLGQDGNLVRYAVWAPQVGGYCAHAVLEFFPGNECYDLWIWHDGEFPCDTPILLHGCDATQLVKFGTDILTLMGR